MVEVVNDIGTKEDSRPSLLLPEAFEQTTDDGDAPGHAVSLTRRRGDAAGLLVRSMQARTVSRGLTAGDGKVKRPSMFITLTLPSYGRIVRDRGVPVDPEGCDYRRAALYAMYFAKLVGWREEKLSRGAGFKV